MHMADIVRNFRPSLLVIDQLSLENSIKKGLNDARSDRYFFVLHNYSLHSNFFVGFCFTFTNFEFLCIFFAIIHRVLV